MELIEFLEMYLPRYHSSEDVASLDDLHKYIGGEMTAEEEKERGLFRKPYPEAFKEFNDLQDKLFAQAFAQYNLEKTQSKAELKIPDSSRRVVVPADINGFGYDIKGTIVEMRTILDVPTVHVHYDEPDPLGYTGTTLRASQVRPLNEKSAATMTTLLQKIMNSTPLSQQPKAPPKKLSM